MEFPFLCRVTSSKRLRYATGCKTPAERASRSRLTSANPVKFLRPPPVSAGDGGQARRGRIQRPPPVCVCVGGAPPAGRASAVSPLAQRCEVAARTPGAATRLSQSPACLLVPRDPRVPSAQTQNPNAKPLTA